jgi:integrase
LFTVRTLQTAPVGRTRIAPNLYLEVTKDGRTRRFLYRFVSPVTGRATEAGLGVWPATSLADAGAKAAEYRSLIAKKQDPIILNREARAARKAKKEPAATLGHALKAYVDAFRDKGDPTEQLKAALERYAAPLLSHPIAAITTNDVLAVLAPIQARLPRTAARVRAALSTCFNYAIARAMFTGGDPASAAVFKYLMPPSPPSVPHKMMPFASVPSFFARLQNQVSAPRLCLMWLILTASRSQEAIRCEWSEIDMSQRLWVVPAEKIKMRRTHKVWISNAALAVLEQARQMGDDRYVFPSMTRGTPLGPRVLEGILHKTMGEPYSVHAFRASFSTFCNETQSFAFEDVEMCLAHLPGNSISRAYDRSEKLAKRAAILEAWAAYITGATVPNILIFPSAARS